MSDDDIYGRKKGFFSKIQNILVGVLVGMLVLAFAVWGVEDVFSPNSSNSIARVGDAEIGRVEFTNRFNDRMREYAEANGEGLTNQQAFDRGLPQQLLQQIQQDLAIEADASDLGVSANNRDVRRFVENIDAFRNEITQELDETQMRRLLANNRITQAEFEQDIVNALVQQQTLPAIMGGIEAPSDYARRFNDFINEVRTARLIRLSEANIDPIDEPSDTDLQSYIAANQARFTAPEYRQLLMIRLEPFDFAPDIEVTDEQVRERFDSLVGAGELGSNESRDVSIISVQTEAEATAVTARINAGEDAATVASELSLPAPDQFNGIGPDGLLNPASAAVAFSTEEGQADIAPTEFGTFDVVIVRAINPGEVPDFESLEAELRQDVIEGEARRIISDYERIIDDMILEGATVEEIAEEIDVPVSGYPFIDRTGTTQDGVRLNGFPAIPGIARDERLLQAIFTSDIGFESEITATSNNGLALFRVTDVIEATPRDLEEVRNEAEAGWRSSQLIDALTSKGAGIAGRIRQGETLETIAEEEGLNIETLAVQRASPPRSYSQPMLVSLLEGDVGSVARGAGVNGQTYEVAVLDRISNSGELIGGEILQTVQERVSEQIALDISRAYETAILNDKGAQIFDDQVRAALNLTADQ